MSAPIPCLVDSLGRPITSGSGSSNRWLDASDNSGRRRPSEPARTDDINRLVPPMDRRVCVALSERVITNFDVVDGAMWMKGMLSVGRAWEPQFLGEAKDWGKKASRWLLDEWYKIGDLGDLPDSRWNLVLDSVTLDRSGDFGIMLSSYEGGYPATQRIPPWRIGVSRLNGVEMITSVRATRNPDGTPVAAKGEPIEIKLPVPLAMRDGIIYDLRGRRLYTRVRLDNGLTPTRTDDFIDLHRRDFWLVYDKAFYEAGRGWPSVRASVNKLRDSLKSHEWEQLALLIASSISLIEYNETGTPQGSGDGTAAFVNGAPAPPSAGGLTTQTFYEGLYRFFKAGSGAKLEQFVNQRPGDPWGSFNDRIIHAALRGMNWSPMLAYGKESPGGQLGRSDIGQVNVSIADRQDVLGAIKAREDGYAISKAIQLKILDPYPGPDLGGQFKWGYSFPAEFSIDDGRDAQNLREDYKIGFVNDRKVFAIKGGKTVADHWAERAADVATRQRARIEENAKPENVALGIVVTDRDMQMLGPNEQPDGVTGTGEIAGGETEDGKKTKPKDKTEE